MIQLIDIQQPVIYYESGNFLATTGWQHNLYQHQKDYELIIGIEGEIFLQIDKMKYQIKKGDVLLVTPFQQINGYQQAKQNSSFFWLHFFIDHKSTAIELDKINKLGIKRQLVLPAYFELKQFNKVFVLMSQLLDMTHANYYSQDGSDYMTTLLLIELTNQFLGQTKMSWLVDDQGRINRIKEWIKSHLTEELTVSQVASHWQINPDYLTRLFKRYADITTKEFINQCKLDLAKNQLLATSDTIEQVAAAAFFPSTKNFMKYFKQKVFVTPTQYRQTYTQSYQNTREIDPGIDINRYLNFVEQLKKP